MTRTPITPRLAASSLLSALTMLSGCLQSSVDETSESSLIGGVPIASKETFPGTAGLHINKCTVTKVGAHHLLTAGHCVCATSGGAVVQTLKAGATISLATGLNANEGDAQVSTVTARAVTVNPTYASYNFQSGISLREVSDVAVIEIEEETPSLTAIPIYTGAVPAYTPVAMVGYGCEVDPNRIGASNDSTRRLKAGENYIASVSNGAYPIRGCNGDSGGALFARTAAGLTVVGVNSFALADGSFTFAARLDADTPGSVATWLKALVPDLRFGEKLLDAPLVAEPHP